MSAFVQLSKGRALPEDFERMFQQHHALVYRTAYRVTGNAEDAEDVLQTLFLRLLRRKEPANFHVNPRAYLHRAAVNISLDVLRRRRHEVSPDESIPAGDRTREAVEAQELVVAALAELSPKSAEMFVLKHVVGYDNHEIAKIIGSSKGAVAVMLFRARAQLKKFIRRRMEDKL